MKGTECAAGFNTDSSQRRRRRLARPCAPPKSHVPPACAVPVAHSPPYPPPLPPLCLLTCTMPLMPLCARTHMRTHAKSRSILALRRSGVFLSVRRWR